jgi:hypothetical protein
VVDALPGQRQSPAGWLVAMVLGLHLAAAILTAIPLRPATAVP